MLSRSAGIKPSRSRDRRLQVKDFVSSKTTSRSRYTPLEPTRHVPYLPLELAEKGLLQRRSSLDAVLKHFDCRRFHSNNMSNLSSIRDDKIQRSLEHLHQTPYLIPALKRFGHRRDGSRFPNSFACRFAANACAPFSDTRSSRRY